MVPNGSELPQERNQASRGISYKISKDDTRLAFFKNLRFKKRGIGRGGREYGVSIA